jgi:hypothetical protein
MTSLRSFPGRYKKKIWISMKRNYQEWVNAIQGVTGLKTEDPGKYIPNKGIQKEKPLIRSSLPNKVRKD